MINEKCCIDDNSLAVSVKSNEKNFMNFTKLINPLSRNFISNSVDVY